MTNIFEAVQELQIAKTSSAVLLMVKNKQALSLEASSSLKSSHKYHLTNIDITKVPSLSASNALDDGPLVIDLNVDRLCKTGSQFIPRLLVISGLNKLK